MIIIMIGSEDVTKKDVMKRGVLRKKNVAGKQKNKSEMGQWP